MRNPSPKARTNWVAEGRRKAEVPEAPETPPFLNPVRERRGKGRQGDRETGKRERTHVRGNVLAGLPHQHSSAGKVAGECGGKAEEEETDARSRSRRRH